MLSFLHQDLNRPHTCWARAAVSILWVLIVLAPISSRADNLRVLLLLSDSSPAYQSFGNTLKNSLPASIQFSAPEQPEKISTQPEQDLIVAVGMQAAVTATTQTSSPVLAVMITRAGYEELLAQTSPQKRSKAISAIYLDQPWTRQIDFIQAVLPKHRRIGLLYTPNVHTDLTFMQRQVSVRGATLIAKPVLSADNVFPHLEDLLENSDVLLALPNGTIYNNNNIRNILLSTYRSGIPFIGLSQSYVTAGALGAVFSSPEQMAGQANAAIHFFELTGKLPELQYPRDFTISLNTEVARSLGIELPSTNIVRQRMNSANRGAP